MKKIFEEQGLYNQEIPYMTAQGILFVKSDILLDLVLRSKGKSLKEFYRVVLRKKDDREELIDFLGIFASRLALDGAIFKDSITRGGLRVF